MKRFHGIAWGIAWLAVPAAIGALNAPVPAVATTYGGRATGCTLPPTTVCDTGELPPGGGTLSDFVPNCLLTGNNQVVIATNLSASASASGTVSQCESQVQELSVELHELLFSTTITATSVGCVAVAACGQLSGESRISGLAIGGVSVVVTGEANQFVDIPGIATLVINEQVFAEGEITVNALHATLLSGTEIVVCAARAAIRDCEPLPVEQSSWGKVKALFR